MLAPPTSRTPVRRPTRHDSRVDVHPAAADEAAERHAAIAGELDRERRRRADRDEKRATGDGRLLHELEREPAADAQHGIRERQAPSAERPANDLVHRVVPADVLAEAEERPLGVEQAGRVDPACRVERRLRLSQAVGERREHGGVDAEVALDPRRLDRNGFECALPADAARARRVEAAREPAGIEARRVELDRVRSEVVGEPRAFRPQAFGQREAERELLVVTGRPHRHRDRPAADPDLERLLDRDDVRRVTVRDPDDLDLRRRVRRDAHRRSIAPEARQ